MSIRFAETREALGRDPIEMLHAVELHVGDAFMGNERAFFTLHAISRMHGDVIVGRPANQNGVELLLVLPPIEVLVHRSRQEDDLVEMPALLQRSLHERPAV